MECFVLKEPSGGRWAANTRIKLTSFRSTAAMVLDIFRFRGSGGVRSFRARPMPETLGMPKGSYKIFVKLEELCASLRK